MNLYFLLADSIGFATANNLMLHKFGNKGLNSFSSVLLFNAGISGIWLIILSIIGMFSGGLHFTSGSVLWGIAYGAVISLFLLCKMQALATGPVSLTSFLGCASLLISTGFGVFVLHEDASLIQEIGVILLITALFLIVSPKNDSAKPSWKLWCGGFFLCSAATGIIFKLHQRSESATYINEMLIVASITSASLFFILALLLSNHNIKKCKVPKSAFIWILCCGIVSCGYNRLNVTLTGGLSSIIFFPLFNGSVILISTLAGIFLFKEKLKPAQTIGIIIGAVALLLASGTVDGIIAYI